MSDLDDEELEATRKLNGADKTSNIEEDIKNIKQYINLVLDKGYCDCNELNVISTGKYCDGSKNVAYSMQNILAEREQKDKRIKELEDDLYSANCIISDLTDSIPVQKVKDKIEEYKKQKDKYESETQEVFANNYYHRKILELTHKILGLEKLLEGK